MAADVAIVWAYAKRGNSEDFDWVSGNEDPSKASRFRDYEVQVFSKPTAVAAYVLRRTEHVATELYTYTVALNTADAGSFMPYVRFDVLTRETTGQNSPVKSVEAVVVT